MPLLVPIHNPSRVVGAAYGNFLCAKRKVLLVATALALQFYDEQLNMHTFEVPVGSPINSIGTIRCSDLDSILLCLRNGQIHVLSYSKSGVFVNKLIEINSEVKLLEFLCTNEDQSIALIKTNPSQILVLRASSNNAPKANLYGGRWGRVFGACFVDDRICLLENDPATTPQLGIYTLGNKGFTVESKLSLIDLDPSGPIRLAPCLDGVLVYDIERIDKYTLDGDHQLVANRMTLCICSTDGMIIVADRCGVISEYNQTKNTLRDIGKLESSPSYMVWMDGTAFCWGNAHPTQMVEFPAVKVIKSFSTLGPVMEILPFDTRAQSKLMVLTSSIFDLETYDKCFCTLSRLDFTNPAVHLASLETTINPTHLVNSQDSTVLLCSVHDTTVLEVGSEGVVELDSYLFYNLQAVTLAGNSSVQISTSFLKTKDKCIDKTIDYASVREDEIAVSQGTTLTIYSMDLDVISSKSFPSQITLLKYVSELAIATTDHLYIGKHELDVPGVSDVEAFGDYLAVATRDGWLHFYKDFTKFKSLHLVSDPPRLFIHDGSLIMVSDKTIRFGSNLYYEAIGFDYKVSLLLGLSNSVLLSTRKDHIDFWNLESQEMTTIQTMGTGESIDAVLKHKEKLITASRDDEDYQKCNFFLWAQDLTHSDKIFTLSRPNEVVQQVLVVSFTGFEGLLISLNHQEKDECRLLLVDLNNVDNEPNDIYLATGMITKMAIKSNQPSLESTEVYLLNDHFFGLIKIDKTGAEITVLNKRIDSGRDLDVYGDQALILDYFEKTELCSLSNNSAKHTAWLENTQETTTALILPPSLAYPHTSYLVATEGRQLYQFESEEKNFAESKFPVAESITSMARPSRQTDAQYPLDAFLGTSQGAVYAYMRLPGEIDASLAVLASRVGSNTNILCPDNSPDSNLILWPLIRDLSTDKLNTLCSELNINPTIIDGIKESINAFVY